MWTSKTSTSRDHRTRRGNNQGTVTHNGSVPILAQVEELLSIVCPLPLRRGETHPRNPTQPPHPCISISNHTMCPFQLQHLMERFIPDLFQRLLSFSSPSIDVKMRMDRGWMGHTNPGTPGDVTPATDLTPPGSPQLLHSHHHPAQHSCMSHYRRSSQQ